LDIAVIRLFIADRYICAAGVLASVLATLTSLVFIFSNLFYTCNKATDYYSIQYQYSHPVLMHFSSFLTNRGLPSEMV